MRVSRAPGLFWVDYQALTNVMNFYRTDPVREWDRSPPAERSFDRFESVICSNPQVMFVCGPLRLSSKPAHPKALHRRSVTMAACFGRPPFC